MTSVTLGFRPATPDDAPFLFDLYVSTREGEFALLDDAQRTQLLRLQFTAQQTGYASQFPGSEHRIILNGGEAVGRVWIARSDREIRVVDISLLPQHRRRGIGTAVYRRVLADAAAQHKTVAASVLNSNAASLAFHRSLGFSIVEQSDVYCPLARRP